MDTDKVVQFMNEHGDISPPLITHMKRCGILLKPFNRRPEGEEDILKMLDNMGDFAEAFKMLSNDIYKLMEWQRDFLGWIMENHGID